MKDIYYVLILALYYIAALIFRALYLETVLKYYMLFFIPLMVFTFAFIGHARKTIKDALIQGLKYGLIFGAVIGFSEVLIFHFLAEIFPQKLSIVVGDFVTSGFNWNLVTIPLYRTGLYALSGIILSAIGFYAKHYRK